MDKQLDSDVTPALPAQEIPDGDKPTIFNAESVISAPPAASEGVKRGRGRPRKDGSKPSAVADKKAEKAALVKAEALASAQMVVIGLDTVAAAVSGGEYDAARSETRKPCVDAWVAYLELSGGSLPPWVTVTAMSLAHVAPAFMTPRGKGLLEKTWDKARALWLSWCSK